MAQKIRYKKISNTTLANEYGGWIYCNGCGNTIGYLCYVTYGRFCFRYHCRCGNEGSIFIEKDDAAEEKLTGGKEPVIIKNRFCCTEDSSPLVTILSKKWNTIPLTLSAKSAESSIKKKKEYKKVK